MGDHLGTRLVTSIEHTLLPGPGRASERLTKGPSSIAPGRDYRASTVGSRATGCGHYPVGLSPKTARPGSPIMSGYFS
jgi:hypothetical protein